MMEDKKPTVVIIGAGMAGLTCAKYLRDSGIEALVLEASDGVGGRVRTDVVDGFRLDRGFQVLLTSYPEAQKLLDYSALRLQKLPSGARIRKGNQFSVMPNPLKNPTTAPTALFAPVGSFWDKLKVLQLNLSLRNAPEPLAGNTKKQTTIEFLRDFGYSDTIIERFFRPFFRGVFLEKNLETDASFFQFLFNQFAKGDVVVPEKGMQAIAEQIAANLAPQQIRLNTQVIKIDGQTIHLENGQTIEATKLILATDASATAKLLGEANSTCFNSTSCLYFKSDQPISKSDKPYLMINSNTNEIIDHLVVLSDVAPTYAPVGKTLISVSLVGKNAPSEQDLVQKVEQELRQWFGDAHNWKHLRTYQIPEALPQYFEMPTQKTPLKINDFTYRCGDYLAYPSLNAAMKTGREVAEMIVAEEAPPRPSPIGRESAIA
jgi:phytoene dehydrogenase-like protein